MKDRTPYPEFEYGNPGKPGCTVKDSSTMSVWSNLLEDFSASNNSFAARPHKLPFVYDKAAMSLELLPLQDIAGSQGNLLCYVHLRAMFIDREMQRSSMILDSARVQTLGGEYTVAIAPMQILPVEVTGGDGEDKPSEPNDTETSDGPSVRSSAALYTFTLAASIMVLALLVF